MHYYLYQTRNTVNDKVYIGVHQTEDLNDGYLGSGTLLGRAIEKYGLEAFQKTILETFDSAEAMYTREAEVVDEAFLRREDVYNLKVGGNGGFDYLNNHPKSKEWKVKGGVKGGKLGRKTQREKKLGVFDPEVQRRAQSKAVEAALSEESRAKQKTKLAAMQHQQGERNNQFGTRWITNGIKNARIHKGQHLPDGWRFGRSMGV